MKSQSLRIFTIVALTAIITALLTFYLCKSKEHAEIPEKDRSNTICMDYNTDLPPVLTSELVKSMVAKYDSVQLYNIENATSNAVPRDARAIWFDLETLKKFLYHIEHNVSKNYALGQNKRIGVRIYYAAYPKNERMRDMSLTQADPNFTYNTDYENLHTLVMIPTISGANGVNYDFNPIDAATYNGFVNMDTKDKFSFINDSYSILTLGSGSDPVIPGSGQTNNSINARNHGVLTPPDSVLGFGF
ncbi:hypothetical protein [Flavobacterium sp.]|uniref:hypothetical protein n=1 Tax=Flavobacterium sp. TaxID=239 RepID=UPI0037510E84